MELPWYDSIWLQVYSEARSIIAVQAPGELSDFEHAFAPLNAPARFATQHLKAHLERDEIEQFCSIIAGLDRTIIESHELLSFGREVVHDHPAITAFQKTQTELVSELAGEALTPSYNFLSLYNNLGVCDLHMDAPTSKWTLDLCIKQNVAWPIHISGINPWPEADRYSEGWQSAIASSQTFGEYTMQPGDALFFAGSNQWHYRERIPRPELKNFCHLIFLHYVPEGVEHLLDPSNWQAYFGIPALAALNPVLQHYQAASEDNLSSRFDRPD